MGGEVGAEAFRISGGDLYATSEIKAFCDLKDEASDEGGGQMTVPVRYS